MNSAKPKARQSNDIDSQEGLLAETTFGSAMRDLRAATLVANPAAVESEWHPNRELHASDEILVRLARVAYDEL